MKILDIHRFYLNRCNFRNPKGIFYFILRLFMFPQQTKKSCTHGHKVVLVNLKANKNILVFPVWVHFEGFSN